MTLKAGQAAGNRLYPCHPLLTRIDPGELAQVHELRAHTVRDQVEPVLGLRVLQHRPSRPESQVPGPTHAGEVDAGERIGRGELAKEGCGRGCVMRMRIQSKRPRLPARSAK